MSIQRVVYHWVAWGATAALLLLDEQATRLHVLRQRATDRLLARLSSFAEATQRGEVQ